MLFLDTFSLVRSGTGLAEGETGQAEPDWPASADWLIFALNQLTLSSRSVPVRDLVLLIRLALSI